MSKVDKVDTGTDITIRPMSHVTPSEGCEVPARKVRGPDKTPGAYPRKDRRAGLGEAKRRRRDGTTRKVTLFEPDVALEVVERVAQGELLSAITRDKHMPSRHTFMRWVLEYPELRKAFDAARELSAIVLEEEAILAGRDLRKSPGTAQKVRAHEVLMNQLRWSATKRDPKRFGERRDTNVVVPIQINTTLDLGSTSDVGADGRSMYDLVLDAHDVTPSDPPSEAPEDGVWEEGDEGEGPPPPPEKSLLELPRERHKNDYSGLKQRWKKKRLTPRMSMDEELDYEDKPVSKTTLLSEEAQERKNSAKKQTLPPRDDRGVPGESEGAESPSGEEGDEGEGSEG